MLVPLDFSSVFTLLLKELQAPQHVVDITFSVARFDAFLRLITQLSFEELLQMCFLSFEFPDLLFIFFDLLLAVSQPSFELSNFTIVKVLVVILLPLHPVELLLPHFRITLIIYVGVLLHFLCM